MRKIYTSLFIAILTSIFACISPFVTQAVTFTSASIRPGTHSIGVSPLPILITVNTATAATEDSIKLTVPLDYQYSGTASNYTVSTALLPSGVTALPGITTASSVSSNTITFTTSDLQTGITYGFYLTGGITSNPSTVSVAESVWKLESFASGGSVDVTFLTVPVETSSSVTVTGTVPPASSNFSVSLSSSSSATLSQEEQSDFRITYSTEYPTNTSLTLQASWEKGKIGSSTVASVDVAEYVSGTATNAYGGAAPIIDPVARTITWTIPAISSSAGEQTVDFSLITTSNYQGSSDVSFTVTAAVTSPVTSLPSSITKTYLYDPPASSGSSSSTSTPTPTPTPTATPTVSAPVVVQSVSIPSLSDTTATLGIQLGGLSSIEVFYGTTPSDLNQRLVVPIESKEHTVLLKELKVKTTYYFRVQTTSTAGVTNDSDLYTFTTASQPLTSLSGAVVNIGYNGIPLLSTSIKQKVDSFILPENQTYEMSVTFPDDTLLKSFRASVLYSAPESVGAAYQVPFVKVGKNTYVVSLMALAPYGNYDVFFDIEDFFGNKQTSYMGSFKVVKPLTIYDAESNEPVEHAEIEIERYNIALQLYEKLELIGYGPVTQWQSNSIGVIKLALPEGKYRIKVSAPAYQDQVVEFKIDSNLDEYPQIKLLRQDNYYFGRFGYYANTIDNLVTDFNPVFASLLRSKNIFKVVSFFSITILTAGLVLSLSAKTNIPVFKLHEYLWNRLRHFRLVHHKSFLFRGKVIDSLSNKSVSGAEIAVLDRKDNVVVTMQSARNGYFNQQLKEVPAKILVTETGYHPSNFEIPVNYSQEILLFKLTNKSIIAKAETKLGLVFKFVTSSMFEFLLIMVCIAQFYFIENFGVAMVLPLLIVAVLNVIIWTLYLSTQILPEQFTELEAIK